MQNFVMMKAEQGQLWSLDANGNLCNKHNKCLAAASGNNGQRMVQFDKNSQDGQLWSFINGNLCNKYNKCLASPGNKPNNGVGLIQWSASGEQGQQWAFV
jgi:hypothetical protein|uniref:Ricin B lectin domain-containing protein n=1 Tax=viral metagenome TaxID=1070528 RepID=A0A6C0AMQ4_9ZZZZ